jgi:hypothetical protein
MMTLKSAVAGFKEWLVVCDALGAGRQSIILRKGGIAEGRGGFQWQREDFLLFPTHFHQQRDQVTWEPGTEARADLERPEEVVIRYAARAGWSGRVDDWETAAALGPQHVWTETVVRDRFGYGGETGLSVAVVRVFRLVSPVVMPMEARFGGCRSWVDLPEAGALEMVPVLDDRAHGERLRELGRLLPMGAPGG